MLVALWLLFAPFAVKVCRDTVASAEFLWTSDQAAIIWPISVGRFTAIVDLQEGFDFLAACARADRTVWVISRFNRGLFLPPSRRDYYQEQNRTDNRVAHVQ